MAAFPPNFIHSLDASHMFLSALKCNELGLDFAAVHDSYWTHAADVPKMGQVLRDCFVRMHQEDVVGRLAAEFEARYAGCIRLENVFTNSLLGQRIKQWRTERRSAETCPEGARPVHDSLDEVLLEYERQKGRKMITPASIYEAAVPEDFLNSDEQGLDRTVTSRDSPSDQNTEGFKERPVEFSSEGVKEMKLIKKLRDEEKLSWKQIAKRRNEVFQPAIHEESCEERYIRSSVFNPDEFRSSNDVLHWLWEVENKTRTELAQQDTEFTGKTINKKTSVERILGRQIRSVLGISPAVAGTQSNTASSVGFSRSAMAGWTSCGYSLRTRR